MDLSKLPKLSNTRAEQSVSATEPTPSDQAPADSPRDQRVEYRAPGAYTSPGIGADVWVNLIIGLLLVGMGFTFARFLTAKATGQPFRTNVNWVEGPKAGTEVDYFELQDMSGWTQMGMFLFGLVLLFEAAAKLVIALRPSGLSRGLIALALGLTLLTTALNVFVCIKFMGAGQLPLLSGMAVAFGGWIVADEWRLLQQSRDYATT